MRRNLFWLRDEQWKRIEPHLPTDVRGIERVDDRRVISGIVHVLKRFAAGVIARPSMARRRRSTTAPCAGRVAGSGKTFSGSWRGAGDRRTCRCRLGTRQSAPRGIWWKGEKKQ